MFPFYRWFLVLLSMKVYAQKSDSIKRYPQSILSLVFAKSQIIIWKVIWCNCVTDDTMCKRERVSDVSRFDVFQCTNFSQSSFNSWAKQLKGYAAFYSTGFYTMYKFANLSCQHQTSIFKINVSLKTQLQSPFIMGCNSNVEAKNGVHTCYLSTDSILRYINTTSSDSLLAH